MKNVDFSNRQGLKCQLGKSFKVSVLKLRRRTHLQSLITTSLKYIPISRLECKNHTLFMTKIAGIGRFLGAGPLKPITIEEIVIFMVMLVMHQSIPKTAHPPRAIRGHFTRFKLRTVGNLT